MQKILVVGLLFTTCCFAAVASAQFPLPPDIPLPDDPPLSTAEVDEVVIPLDLLPIPFVPGTTGPVIVLNVPYEGTTGIEILIALPDGSTVVLNTTVQEGETIIPLFIPPVNSQVPNPLPPGTDIAIFVVPSIPPQPPVPYGPVPAPPPEHLVINVEEPNFPLPPESP